MTDDAKKLSPDLRRWLSDESPPARRTVVMRLAHSKDVESAVESLREAGLEVQSYGPGGVIAVTDVTGLNSVAGFDWVVAVSTPRKLEKRLS